MRRLFRGSPPRDDTDAEALRGAILPLAGGPQDFDPLLELIGDARLVLLGEASHGTAEFYRARAAITRRLIAERGFAGVVAEADWPDAERVDCFVRGAGDDRTAEEALGDFRRFPTWMWPNTEVRDFVAWLRSWNDGLPAGAPKAGFFGMDLYSLHSSIEAVLAFLDRTDPEAARRARERYACFDHHGEEPQRYGLVASMSGDTCEDDAVAQLVELRRAARSRYPRAEDDELFYAEQNARLVRDAEAYYRSMYHGGEESWNLRDTHMADTIDALLGHLDRRFGTARLVVWAHNSHLGDARATEMGEGGQLNVGQLVRERHGDAAVLVGFTTYRGTVTAAREWEDPPLLRRVRDGMPGSYEALLHAVAERGSLAERATGGAPSGGGRTPDFLLPLRGDAAEVLRAPRLERAIGVVYRPETERGSHYFYARLADQFDAVIHYDETTAVEPLDRSAGWGGDGADTFPSGL